MLKIQGIPNTPKHLQFGLTSKTQIVQIPPSTPDSFQTQSIRFGQTVYAPDIDTQQIGRLIRAVMEGDVRIVRDSNKPDELLLFYFDADANPKSFVIQRYHQNELAEAYRVDAYQHTVSRVGSSEKKEADVAKVDEMIADLDQAGFEFNGLTSEYHPFYELKSLPGETPTERAKAFIRAQGWEP